MPTSGLSFPAVLTRRPVVITLSVIAAAAYFFRIRLHPGGGTDLYPQAAECMIKGLPISTCSPDFTYPPLFSFLVIPMVYLPMWARHLGWYLLLLALTVGSIRIAERLVLAAFEFAPSDLERQWLRLASVVLSLNFLLSVFEHQAYDVMVLFCILVGLTGLAKNNWTWMSLGLGFAAAIKATPLLFLPYLLLKQGWKPSALCLGAYAGFSVLPDVFLSIEGGQGTYYGNWLGQVGLQPFLGNYLDHLPAQRPVSDPFWFVDNPHNYSLRQLVLHFTLYLNIQEYFPRLLYGLYGLCGLLGLAVLRWTGESKAAPVVDGSLILIGMLLLSPMSSRTHFVVLLLPFMTTTAYLLMKPLHRPYLLPASVLSCLLNNFTSKDLVGRKLAALAEPWGPVIFGTIMLGLALAYIAYMEKQQPRTASAMDPETG